MRLSATSVGYRVHAMARDRVGLQVLGVFHHAFSLETADGWIVALVSRPRPGPLNVVVPGLEGVLGRLWAGEPAMLFDGAILLAETELSVDLVGAATWPGVALPAGPVAGAEARHASVLRAWELACEMPGRLGWMSLLSELVSGMPPRAARLPDPGANSRWALDGLVLPWALDAARGVCRAMGARDMERACFYAQDLIGLGPGLTPAGDDLLTGLFLTFCLAERAASGGTGWSFTAAAQITALARGRTNRVAEQQLWLAALGEADQALGEAAVALLWDLGSVEQPVLELLRVGSTSGGDMLAGVCLASETLSRPAGGTGAGV